MRRQGGLPGGLRMLLAGIVAAMAAGLYLWNRHEQLAAVVSYLRTLHREPRPASGS